MHPVVVVGVPGIPNDSAVERAMAENAASGQQRSFAKNLSRQSAQEIRENAGATVKAAAEQVD